MKRTPKQTAQWLALRMAELGLKQNDVAELASITASDISRYKAHKHFPDIDTAVRLAGALQCSILEILVAFGKLDPKAPTTPVVPSRKSNGEIIFRTEV
jgi:transcriptional regulator with XRE-family HTH domain